MLNWFLKWLLQGCATPDSSLIYEVQCLWFHCGIKQSSIRLSFIIPPSLLPRLPICVIHWDKISKTPRVLTLIDFSGKPLHPSHGNALHPRIPFSNTGLMPSILSVALQLLSFDPKPFNVIHCCVSHQDVLLKSSALWQSAFSSERIGVKFPCCPSVAFSLVDPVYK